MEKVKTIKDLERILKNNETQIDVLSSKIGYSLLTKEVETWIASPLGKGAQFAIDKYNSYSADRERFQNDIVSIQEILSQIATARDNQSDVKKQITVLQGDWNPLYEQLGLALVDNYSSDFASFFGSYYTDILAEEKKVIDSEQSAQELEKTRAEQSFFKKIVSNVKYTTAISSKKYHENQIKSLAIKGGLAVWASGVLEADGNKSLFPESLQSIYNSCIELKTKIDGFIDENHQLNELLADLSDKLQELEAFGNGKARVNELEKLILEKEQAQGEGCILIGQDFFKLCLNEKKQTIKIPAAFSEETKNNVNQMFKLQKENESSRRKIDILCLVSDNDRLEKQILNFKSAIKSNTDKINTLQNEIQELELHIDENEKRRNEIAEKKSALELLESESLRETAQD